MRLFTFALFVLLLSILGLLTVHEQTERMRSSYRTGRLVSRREKLRTSILNAERDLAVLTTPDRLARLNEKLQLGLAPVPSQVLGPASADTYADVGGVLEEESR